MPEAAASPPRDFPLAVIEAKASYRIASEGLQKAKDVASILEKEQRIAEIMGHIQKLLAGGGS